MGWVIAFAITLLLLVVTCVLLWAAWKQHNENAREFHRISGYMRNAEAERNKLRIDSAEQAATIADLEEKQSEHLAGLARANERTRAMEVERDLANNTADVAAGRTLEHKAIADALRLTLDRYRHWANQRPEAS